MIDWLEEILKLAETQVEADEQEELLSLRFLTVGAVRRTVQDADAEKPDNAVLGIGGAAPDMGVDWMELAEQDSVTWSYGGRNRDKAGMQPESAEKRAQRMAGTASDLEEAIGLTGRMAGEVDLTSEPRGEVSLLHGLREQGSFPWTEVLSDLVRRAGWAELGEETAPGSGRSDVGSGLRALYRRAGEAVRNTAAPAALSGITVLQESPGMAVGLTAEELDRAVRRDSRRYDGGMSIY